MVLTIHAKYFLNTTKNTPETIRWGRGEIKRRKKPVFELLLLQGDPMFPIPDPLSAD